MADNESDLRTQIKFLKSQLAEAHSKIAELTQENTRLKKSNAPPKKQIPNPPVQSIDVLGSNILCENCQQSVPASNYEMHIAFCIRNLLTCEFCRAKIPAKLMPEHMESAKVDPAQLMSYIQNGDLESLDFSVTHGVELPGDFLHLAVQCNKKNLVEYLYAIGFDVNKQNNYGETAMHMAAKNKELLEITKYLIDKGGDGSVPNNLGDTPQSLAQRAGNHEAMMLLNAGGINFRPPSRAQYGNRRAKQSIN